MTHPALQSLDLKKEAHDLSTVVVRQLGHEVCIHYHKNLSLTLILQILFIISNITVIEFPAHTY